MRIWRALALIAAFCVDVHVRADEVRATCFGHQVPCAVQAEGERQVLQAETLNIAMNPHALLEQRASNVIELVNGHFLISAAKPVKFQTPYGRAWCEDECKALFEREDKKLTIKSLGGSWRLTRTGDEQVYAVPPGLQVSIGEVAPGGSAQMEIPQSLPWASTVRDWAALYPGDVKEFKSELAEFRGLWHRAVEMASHMQYQFAKREIASVENERAAELARQKAREREDESLRRLFREKNYLNP